MNNYYVKYMLSNKLWLKRSNLSIDEALTVFSVAGGTVANTTNFFQFIN